MRGAHLQMMCAIGDTTLMLTRHVRERGDLTVEQAVHRMTGQLAGPVRVPGRGRLTEGAAGDLVVFGLDELDWAADVFAAGLARKGARRLRRRTDGYRYTVVGGTVVQRDGELDRGASGPRAATRLFEVSQVSRSRVMPGPAGRATPGAGRNDLYRVAPSPPRLEPRTAPVLARVSSPATYQRRPSRRTVQARACNGRPIGTGLT